MARKKDPTASNQDPSSRGKPRRLKQPTYLPAPFDKMLPLYPERRALEATTAAFAILNSEYPDIAASLVGGSLESIERAEADATPTHPAYLALLDVAHLYWFERRVYERKSNAEFNAELVKIENAVVQLQDSLSNAPPFVRNQLNVWLRTSFQSDSNWLGFPQESDAKTPLRKIENAVKVLASACTKSVTKDGRRGARPKNHITKAIAHLVELWRGLERDFEWRFDTAKGSASRPAPQFIGKGPQFVWRLMSVIDPDLRIGEVRSALKTLSRKKSAMSKNLSSVSAKSKTRKRVR